MADLSMIAGGLLLLILGGEMLVRGAVGVAERAGMSPLLIGLTLVGFGTSTPELVTSIQASLSGSPGIAVGNIVGSNISNILLILGLAALISPVAVASQALRRDGSIVLASALLMGAIGVWFTLDRFVGAALVAMLVAYLVYAYRQETVASPTGGHTAAYEKAEAFEELHDGKTLHPDGTVAVTNGKGAVLSLLLALGGLAVVVLGGKLLVDGATGMARSMGISETLIGLTIVAVGTSLPELVTSIVAALRKHSDVALGNIMGSNIYNILGIGGVTALVAPTTVPPEIVRFDAPAMIAASVALLAFASTGLRIGRREGAALLAGYGAYLWAIWPK